MEKVYISGRIKGIDNAKEIFNNKQIELERLGYSVTNPFNVCSSLGLLWGEYMRFDIRALTFCDSIYMLKGYEKSKGANIELTVAQAIGLKVIYE
jgi:hypothetical protein